MKNKCGDPIELGTSRSNSNLENKIYDDAAAQVSKDSVYDNTEITLTHDDRIDMERMGKKQVLRVRSPSLRLSLSISATG